MIKFRIKTVTQGDVIRYFPQVKEGWWLGRTEWKTIGYIDKDDCTLLHDSNETYPRIHRDDCKDAINLYFYYHYHDFRERERDNDNRRVEYSEYKMIGDVQRKGKDNAKAN